MLTAMNDFTHVKTIYEQYQSIDRIYTYLYIHQYMKQLL